MNIYFTSGIHFKLDEAIFHENTNNIFTQIDFYVFNAERKKMDKIYETTSLSSSSNKKVIINKSQKQKNPISRAF